MTELPCAQAGCEQTATHVVAETSPLNCLFASGAGLMCAACAKNCEEVGGISLSFEGFVRAIKGEGGR